MSKKDRDEFQRGRESMHSEMEQLRALAREAGELMMVLHPECKVPGCPMNDFYTKLRAAGLLGGNNGME